MPDKKKLNNNKELSARLMAVQAHYQILQNKKPAKLVIEEYFERGIEVDDECGVYDDLAPPHGVLFKKILYALEARSEEINVILLANINKKEIPIEIISEEEEKPVIPKKELEPLLNSIVLCGICELLVHDDIDAPLIINDYLNITHSFYEQQQVSFVNGVLDKIASVLR